MHYFLRVEAMCYRSSLNLFHTQKKNRSKFHVSVMFWKILNCWFELWILQIEKKRGRMARVATTWANRPCNPPLGYNPPVEEDCFTKSKKRKEDKDFVSCRQMPISWWKWKKKNILVSYKTRTNPFIMFGAECNKVDVKNTKRLNVPCFDNGATTGI